MNTRTQERIAALERRMDVLAAVLEGYGPPPPDASQEPVHAVRQYEATAPPGVVSPHVRENLEALSVWTDPNQWTLHPGCAPDEMARTRALLEHLHGLVALALCGKDVPRP